MKIRVTHYMPMPKYEGVMDIFEERLSAHNELFLMLGDEETGESPEIPLDRIFGVVLPDTVDVYDNTVVYEAFIFEKTSTGAVVSDLIKDGHNLRAYFKMMARVDDDNLVWRQDFQILGVSIEPNVSENSVELIE